jgi:hypothetical protein
MEETTRQSVTRRCQSPAREEPPRDAEQRVPVLRAPTSARTIAIYENGPREPTIVTSAGRRQSPLRPFSLLPKVPGRAIEFP